MASERSRIKKAVVPASAEPAEPPLLQNALSAAHQLQHELAKEDNRSREALREMELNAKAIEQRVELGKVGQFLGGKDMAPVAIAALAVFFGLVATFVCFHYAAYSASPQTWTREAEVALAFSSAALSFIFGRASKR